MRSVRRQWKRHRLLVMSVLALLSLVLGYVGFEQRFGGSLSIGDRLYRTLKLFSFDAADVRTPVNPALEIARWLAPVTTAYAGFRVLSAIFREQATRLRIQWAVTDHVLICGLGELGQRLAQSFRQGGDRVVIIEHDPTNSSIVTCREAGIPVVVGTATDDAVLRLGGARKARILVAACGDDGTNAAVVAAARRLGRERNRMPLTAFVHISDVELCKLLNERSLVSATAAAGRLEFINVYQSAPAALLAEVPSYHVMPAVGRPAPHLVIAGMGPCLGAQLVVHAVRGWKLTRAAGAPKLRITIVDAEAARQRQALSEGMRGIEDVCDLTALDIDPTSLDRASASGLLDAPTAVFVCLDDDADGVRAALAMRRLSQDGDLPVVVVTWHRGGLARLVGAEGATGIRDFPLLERVYRAEVLLNGINETIARAMHEDYVRQAGASGESPATNPSMVHWDELPERLRSSNRLAAADVGSKLTAVGCDIEAWTDWDAEPVEFTSGEIEILARMEHDRWAKERRAAGWTLGPAKDVAGRTSPKLRPWAELSDDDRGLDRNQVRELPAFLARAGFIVVRRAVVP